MNPDSLLALSVHAKSTAEADTAEADKPDGAAGTIGAACVVADATFEYAEPPAAFVAFTR